MGAGRRCFAVAAVLLFVASSIHGVLAAAPVPREEAVSAISWAEEAVAEAYRAILDAETAGADVSSLLAKLSGGATLLSEAHMAFRGEEFEEAEDLAESAREAGMEVVVEAGRLEVEAFQAEVNRSWWLIVGSVFAVTVVLIGSFLGYHIFKGRYYRRLLKMRPRVEMA